MKIEHDIKIPKTDFDDYSPVEQKLMMVMGAVRGTYQTEWIGMEKALTVRLNFKNAPRVEALTEMSELSKNVVINEMIELAFELLLENLNDDDSEAFTQKVNQKIAEWTGL